MYPHPMGCSTSTSVQHSGLAPVKRPLERVGDEQPRSQTNSASHRQNSIVESVKSSSHSKTRETQDSLAGLRPRTTSLRSLRSTTSDASRSLHASMLSATSTEVSSECFPSGPSSSSSVKNASVDSTRRSQSHRSMHSNRSARRRRRRRERRRERRRRRKLGLSEDVVEVCVYEQQFTDYLHISHIVGRPNGGICWRLKHSRCSNCPHFMSSPCSSPNVTR